MDVTTVVELDICESEQPHTVVKAKMYVTRSPDSVVILATNLLTSLRYDLCRVRPVDKGRETMHSPSDAK